MNNKIEALNDLVGRRCRFRHDHEACEGLVISTFFSPKGSVKVVINYGNDEQNFATKLLSSITVVNQSGLTVEEEDYARTGQKIYAIKSVRERLGIGLKESKDLVEDWMSKHVLNPFPNLPPLPPVQTKDKDLTWQEIGLVKNGRALDAIKTLRARLGIGLKDAKDLVDNYRNIMDDFR